MSPGESPDYTLGLCGAVQPNPKSKTAIFHGSKNTKLNQFTTTWLLAGFRWTLVTNKGHFISLQLHNLLARKVKLRETIKNKLDLSRTVQIYHLPDYKIIFP